jgi:hypothetical protein
MANSKSKHGRPINRAVKAKALVRRIARLTKLQAKHPKRYTVPTN